MTVKFTGMAYWEVRSKDAQWLERAWHLLRPLEGDGAATLQFEAETNCLTVSFCDEHHKMSILKNAGSSTGTGVVRHCRSAPLFIVCLMAMNKGLGDMGLATDSQETIPAIPRQSHHLFSSSWKDVLSVAQTLGLVASVAFLERIGANRVMF